MNQDGFSNSMAVMIALVVIAAGVLGFVLLGGEDDDASTTTETSEVASQSEADDTAEQETQETEAADDEGQADEEDGDAATKSFTIDAFAFGFSEDTINVSPGDEVTITLTNSGGSHNWVVDEIEGAATSTISTSETDTITFTVPESAAGQTFDFYCSVGNHRDQGMEGQLVVSN